MASPKSKEYRELALECLRRLERARDESERIQLLELAARWMRAAVEVEGADQSNHDVPTRPKRDNKT
jgi:hypothetical protein